MNQQERDALREKHTGWHWNDESGFCKYCYRQGCDAAETAENLIKVLDAWEDEREAMSQDLTSKEALRFSSDLGMAAWSRYLFRVLDAWEAERTQDSEHPELKIPSPVQSSTSSEPAEKPTCQHPYRHISLTVDFDYCPLCGEKL